MSLLGRMSRVDNLEWDAPAAGEPGGALIGDGGSGGDGRGNRHGGGNERGEGRVYEDIAALLKETKRARREAEGPIVKVKEKKVKKKVKAGVHRPVASRMRIARILRTFTTRDAYKEMCR